jgi:hypothetical protein
MPLRARITTVTTPATSFDLTNLATIKDELQIKDVRSDAFLTRQISWASTHAANYCNRVFVSETVKDEFWPARDAANVEPLQLTRFPVVSVSAVTEDGVALVDGTDYRLDKDRAQLFRLDDEPYPTFWPSWPIVVTYVTGYATIPADVVDAVIRLVKMRWFARTRDPMLRHEAVTGIRDVDYWVATGEDAGSMPPDVADLLDTYRAPVFG